MTISTYSFPLWQVQKSGKIITPLTSKGLIFFVVKYHSVISNHKLRYSEKLQNMESRIIRLIKFNTQGMFSSNLVAISLLLHRCYLTQTPKSAHRNQFKVTLVENWSLLLTRLHSIFTRTLLYHIRHSATLIANYF